MAIKQTKYVRITSVVAGALAVHQQQLVGRRFTDDPLVPIGEIIEVMNGGAAEYFDAGSENIRFANQYFGYISPAPASQAERLQFCAYAPLGRQSRIYSGKLTQSLDKIKEADIELRFRVGETNITLDDLDFSEATSYQSVSEEISTKLNALLPSGLCLFDKGRLVIESGDQVKVDFDFEESSNAELIGFNITETILSHGSLPMIPLEAFMTAEEISDSFGSASYANEITIDQAVMVAEYVMAQNVKYQFYHIVNKNNAITHAERLHPYASTGVVLNATSGEWKEALPMAIIAATDYDRRNASVNFMFRQSGFSPDVTSSIESDKFDKARVNYYGMTANAGQKINFFQRGYLMGDATAPTDMSVHANEQWLKSYLITKFLSLFISVGKVPANIDGKAMVLAQVAEGVGKALFNGTILIGKKLTELQKIAVSQITGDTKAFHDIENKGYWMDADVFVYASESGVEEYIAKYTLVYAKSDSIRKIEGSHNLI